VLDALPISLASHPRDSVLPLQQNDNVRFCDDPEELAIVAENGGAQIAPMLAAVNQIADAIAEDWPQVLVDTFACESHISWHVVCCFAVSAMCLPADGPTITVPTKIVPRPNVVIRICTAECNFVSDGSGAHEHFVPHDVMISAQRRCP
jgi:hypothetical protein